MDDITVRPASSDDEAGWVECTTGLFSEDAGTYDATMDQKWPLIHCADSFQRGLNDQTRLLLVAATTDQNVIGTLSGSLDGPTAMRPVPVAELVSMYVQPTFRSAGVGGQLVAGFRQWAGQRGARRLAVSAYAANTEALRFYEREGFAAYTMTLEADVALAAVSVLLPCRRGRRSVTVHLRPLWWR